MYYSTAFLICQYNFLVFSKNVLAAYIVGVFGGKQCPNTPPPLYFCIKAIFTPFCRRSLSCLPPMLQFGTMSHRGHISIFSANTHAPKSASCFISVTQPKILPSTAYSSMNRRKYRTLFYIIYKHGYIAVSPKYPEIGIDQRKQKNIKTIIKST